MQCFALRGYVIHKVEDLITVILVTRQFQKVFQILMQFILLNMIPAISWKILISLIIINTLSILLRSAAGTSFSFLRTPKLTCNYNFLISTDKENCDVLFFREKGRWQHFGCWTIRLRRTPNQLPKLVLKLLRSHPFINISTHHFKYQIYVDLRFKFNLFIPKMLVIVYPQAANPQ